MNDLISRQAALDIIDSELNGWLTDDERLHLEGVGTGIECLPTIDPVKHGKWTKHILKNANVPWGYDCSACDGWFVVGEDVIKKYHFCPNCGAQMEVSDVGQ